MRIISTIILFSLQFLFAQGIEQKMIVSAHIQTQKAAQSLYQLEKVFQENPEARKLKEEYRLLLGLELLGPYVAVSIHPITERYVKDRLRYLLQRKFPQNFVVDNTRISEQTVSKAASVPVSMPKTIESVKSKPKEAPPVRVAKEKPVDQVGKIKTFLLSIDSEWWGLLFLALAGFLLIARSARQMSKIKVLQEEVTRYQSKVEEEIEGMGK